MAFTIVNARIEDAEKLDTVTAQLATVEDASDAIPGVTPEPTE